MKREFDKVDENLVFPLSVWLSSYDINAPISQKLNRSIFYIDKKVAKSILFNCIRIRPFLPYPKATKDENKKIELIQKYLVEEYNFGKSDLSSMHKIISNMINSKEFVEEFSYRYGLDNSERKILGLKPLQFDKKLMEKPKKGICLFDI
jgi:hypothetical protein